jgi:hypothetical protein
MDIEDSQAAANPLHNSRVTGLWTACTRLIRKHLNLHKFH